jgi:hypothetical protein
MKKILLFAILLFTFGAQAQDVDVMYTMGYTSITFHVKDKTFFKNYTKAGTESVCGIFTKYNNCIYNCDGKPIKVENTDDISDAKEACCTELKFDDGPRPYAMFDLYLTIVRVDYETNTIYAKTEGADVEIVTLNREIDAYYKVYGKRSALVPLNIKMVLRNWNYTPESEDSYVHNTKKKVRKVHYRSKLAKHEEKYMHDSEYMK